SWVSSRLRLTKKLSTGALSQHCATRLVLQLMPCRARMLWWWSLAYWLPRSEWATRPSPGSRRPIAISNAVIGRPNPASHGRFKPSHFEERQIGSLTSWVCPTPTEVDDGESAQSGHGRDDTFAARAAVVGASDCPGTGH